MEILLHIDIKGLYRIGRLKPKIYTLESFVAILKTQEDTKTNESMDGFGPYHLQNVTMHKTLLFTPSGSRFTYCNQMSGPWFKSH